MADATQHGGDDAIQRHLDHLLKFRAHPKTICPSEVARALSSTELAELDLKEWRDAMPSVRERAWKMREDGRVEILQKGQVLNDDIGLDEIKGPIRIRLILRKESTT